MSLTIRVPQALLLGLVAILLVGGGAAIGYVRASDATRGDAVRDVNARLGDAARETGTLMEQVCFASTKLRSAYTRRTIGHSGRCALNSRNVTSAAAGYVKIRQLARITCDDIEKAVRTAHLRRGLCTPGAPPVARAPADRN